MKFKSIAFQVDLARQIETPATLKRIIDFGGSIGYNQLFLYGEGALEYKSHPNFSSKWALSQKKFLELQRYAKDEYKMSLIPIIPLLGHANFILDNKEFEHLREVRNPDDAVIETIMKQFCSSRIESTTIIEDIIEEWSAISSAPYLHMGGDESWNFATCPECRKKADTIGRGRMLAEHFNHINTIVKKYGKKTMIWHDMLFYYDDCLQYLDKDIIICDWHYENIERHPSILMYNHAKIDFASEYKKHGLSFYIAPAAQCKYEISAANISSFIQYSQNSKPAGFLNTVWEMKPFPYASCYPALAYGAACAQSDLLPDAGEFLNTFAKEHFAGDIETLPFLIELFSEAVKLPAFSGVDKWISYQNSNSDALLSGKLDQALKIIKKIKGKTIPGKAYCETLELIFKRNAIAKKLQSMVNDIAIDFLFAKPVKNKIASKLAAISTLLDKIPAQIKLEEKVWNKNRYKDQSNSIVEQWNRAGIELREFIKSVKNILSEKARPISVFPTFLELSLVNNDCSWQALTISSSNDGKKYYKSGTFPQLGPFGRYVKRFKLTNRGNLIKLELAGLGQLLFHYARVIGPGLELVPDEITKTEGPVIKPENILIDNLKPALMGSTEQQRYFSHGSEQAKATMIIKNRVLKD